MPDEDRRPFATRMGITLEEAQTADYLGDGVYVWADGYHLWLGTLEGMRITLEPGLLKELVRYRGHMVDEGKVPPE